MKFWHTLAVVFLVTFAVVMYALTLKGVPGNVAPKDFENNLDQNTKPFELSPERGRFILTMSLGENKSFALSDQLAKAAYPDVGTYKGRQYVYFAPGISVMALPFYIVGKQYNLSQVFSFSMIAFISVLNLVLLYSISRRIFKLPIWAAFFVAFVFGFATTAWSYAVTLYQHQATTFFILSAFFAIWKFRQKTRFGWLGAAWAWIAFGAAIFIDYPNAIIMAPVMIYLALSAFDILKEKSSFKISIRVSAVLTSIFFILLMALHGYYNYQNFGDWKRLSGSLVGVKDVQEQKLLTTKKSDKLDSLADAKSPVSFFTEEHLPTSNETLLFSRDRGLFFFMPVFLLSLLGIWKLRKKLTTEVNVLLALIVINIFLYSSWGDPWGGWAFGTRYLIPTMAYLSIFLGIWVSKKYSILKAIPTFILLAFSSAVSLLGVLTTNAIPPKVEADYLHTGYNFMRNLDFFKDGRSSSYVFNTYLSHIVTLNDYFLFMYGAIMVVIFALLFILPWFNKNES